MLPYRSDFIPLAVWWGVSVVKSQKRTVVSPEPLARYLKQSEGCVFTTKFTVSSPVIIDLLWGLNKSKYNKKHNKHRKKSHSLAGGAESSWDDSFCVSLQCAGTAGNGSNPEHSLRLVHHWKNLLCLYPESLHTQAQTGHHLSLSTHKKRQWNWLILRG